MSYFRIILAVSGAVTLEAAKACNIQKGDTDPFRTELAFKRAVNGLHVEIKARGDTPIQATEAAVYFVGQHLDILSFWLKEPLHLNPTEYGYREVASNARRIIEPELIDRAVLILPQWREHRKAFLRSLSWYRKAKNSEDPVDRFMSFWSALEGVCAKCFRDAERTRRGVINQIADCFDQVWTDASQWRVIPGRPDWINRLHNTRNGISHGFISVDIEQIKTISEALPTLEALTHDFLTDWEQHGRNIEP